LLLVPLILGAAVYGLYRTRRWSRLLSTMVLIAGALGFIGVSRWVSYPFIPARLLWLLPFIMLAATLGIRHMGGAGRILAVLMLLSCATSIFFYFEKQDYLNKGYAAPLREIAQEVSSKAAPQDLLLTDGYNTDGMALKFYLRSPVQFIVMQPEDEAMIRQVAQKAPSVWIVRNQRDISPGNVTSRIEEEVCASRRRDDTNYLPYEAWQRWVAEYLTKKPVTYFYQVAYCR
jgi:hypothetical protein